MDQYQSKMENGNGGGYSAEHEAAFNDGDVCRDFLKNICNRGTRCKFKHPRELAPEKSPSDNINFCNDYQNSKCLRDNCRFVHAARADAEAFKRTGNVTIGLAKAMAAILLPGQEAINGTPVCKEWLTGNCSRGPNRCRYWHVNPEAEREARLAEMRGSGGASWRNTGQTSGRVAADPHSRSQMPAARNPPMQQQPVQQTRRDFFAPSAYGYEGRVAGSGRFEEPASVPLGYGTAVGGGGAPPKRSRFDNLEVPMRAVSPGYVEDLERKNAELIREMDSLKAELARQRERYEDLYYLHTRGAARGGPPVVASSESLSVPILSGTVHQSSVGVHQSNVNTAVVSSVGVGFGSGVTSGAPAVFTSGSEAHHLVASLAQQVAAAPGLPVQVPLQSLGQGPAMPTMRR